MTATKSKDFISEEKQIEATQEQQTHPDKPERKYINYFIFLGTRTLELRTNCNCKKPDEYF